MYFEDYYPDANSDTTTLSSSANSAGAEIDVTCDDANAWIVNLFDYIKSNENCSMQSAVESAKNQNYDFEGIKTEYIAGGSNTIWQN